MIILVLSMHASDTYSPFGNWYYVDRPRNGLGSGFGTEIFFGVYQSVLQAFFMAVLFFIAGYFSADAYDRKGFSTFIRDRLLRLGLPTLLYMLVIGPLTQYFLSRTWGSGGFLHQWLVHVKDGEWLSETGPMWFCAALLMFSFVYGLVRQTGWTEPRLEPGSIRGTAVAIFVAAMAASTFLVRTGISEGASVLNMHPGDFPQYILMYAAGAFGFRGNWLAGLPDRSCIRWASIALSLSVPLFAALLLLGGGLQGDISAYSGGINPGQRRKVPVGGAGLRRHRPSAARRLPAAVQHSGAAGTLALRQCVRRLSYPPADSDRLSDALAFACAECNCQGDAADRRGRDRQLYGFGLHFAEIAVTCDRLEWL